MQIKKHIRILFWGSFILFILNKFSLRPWILKNDVPEIFRIITLSFPNLIETIMGTVVVTGIVFQIKTYFKSKIRDISVYIISVTIAAIYVISQELKYHNLGGNNVYDTNDLIASILGLIGMFVLFYFSGFIKESERQTT